MRERLLPGLWLPAVLFLLSACGPLSPSPPAGLVPAADSVRAVDRTAAGASAAAVRKNIRQLLAADNCPAALSLVLASGLAEEDVAEEYGRALKGVLMQAEGYREKGLPEKAGPLYRAAIDGYPQTPALAAKVGMPPAGIAAGIETCADQLMERGLTAYRGGDLDRAITAWKQIRVFAPQHQASRKALQTAEVQLANLKKVRSEK